MSKQTNKNVPWPELVGEFNIYTSYRINWLLLRSLMGAASALSLTKMTNNWLKM